MEKNQNNTPVLRFPEFEGEWERKRLGEVMLEGKLGGNYENSESNIGYPVIKMGNIGRGDINLNKIQYLPKEEIFNDNDILKDGDLLFNTRNTLELVGKVAIWRNELPFALYNSNLMRLKFNNQFEPTNRFLNALFNTKKSINQLRCFATGTTSVAAIYSRDLESFIVSFPTLPEQQKIAAFFTAIDKKLQGLKEKKSLLEAYKKGVMQQLFAQEIRFKNAEGGDFEDWEVRRLGEVATFTKGKGISKADISEDGITECIRYGELYTFYGETINDIRSKTNVNVKDLVLSEANDVIIPASGETQIDIATASCVLKAGIALGGDLNIIKSDNNGVFLSYYLNSAKKQDIAGLAQGIAVVHLYSSQLATLNLNLPSLPEQTLIADYLTALDAKIAGVSGQIGAMEAWKKGLLQNMFV